MASNSGSSSSASGGIGFVGLLTIVFIVLKIIHKIGWAWVWVVSPLWIGAAASIAVLLLVFGVIAIVALAKR